MVHACIVRVQSQFILLLCYSMKYTVCWNNLVIVRSYFLAVSVWRWQKLYSTVWKWLLSSVCMFTSRVVLLTVFYWTVYVCNTGLTCDSVTDPIPNSGDKTGFHSAYTFILSYIKVICIICHIYCTSCALWIQECVLEHMINV